MNSNKKCENFGCGQQYREEDNEDICVYHSGKPFFHDAYKGWTCCQKKSTDFTTFLNFKGCSRGKHSDIKRVTEERVEEAPPPPPPVEEEEEKTIDLEDLEIWKNLEISEAKGVSESLSTQEKSLVFCKKCRKSDVSSDECVYHSGQVIFHDSLKYWTCCQNKKFTDFDDFNALPGCERSPNHEMTIETKTREDWFQTSDRIHFILYGLKGVRAKHSSVTTNGILIRAKLKDQTGLELFGLEQRLKHLVSSSESRVMVSSSKVEIILVKRKRDKHWNQLFE